MTDNHSYETPRKGATEWHESLNRNFRYIDRDIEIRDVDAAKGDYRPKSGAKFLATDTENVYVGDGSQWLRLATSGQSPSFDTVSTETIVDRSSGNGYSVDELAGGSGSGGIGPPVDAIVTSEGGTPTAYRSDGTQIKQDGDTGIVLNSAFDHVNSLGGGMVKMSAGTFPISTKPEIHTNTTLAGAGMGQTVFEAQEKECEIIHAGPSVENVLVRDFTFDGRNQGNRTGVNISGNPTDSKIVRVEAINCGPRGEGTGVAIRFRGGTNNIVQGCIAKNCSSVSIGNEDGGQGTVRDCIVLDGNFQTNVGFTHGISVEKSDNAIVQNNYVADGPFAPALNINNVGESLCADNICKNVNNGIRNANGSDTANSITGNVLIDAGVGISVKPGGSGTPQSHLIANNTLQNSKLEVFDGKPTVANNALINSRLRVDVETACSITGNQFLDVDPNKPVLVDASSGTTERLVFAHNFFEKVSDKTPNGPVIRLNHPYGMCIGNSFNSSVGSASEKPTVQINPSSADTYWVVKNNYFRHANSPRGPGLAISADGIVSSNQFDGCRLQGVYDGQSNPPAAETRFNYGTNGAYLNLPDIDTGSPLFSESWGLGFSYTGDGTTGRTIDIAMTPEYLVVEDVSGTKFDVHTQFGNGYQHNTPSGQLSITDGGFTIGDNSADADPNTNGETYTFYAR